MKQQNIGRLEGIYSVNVVTYDHFGIVYRRMCIQLILFFGI